MIRETLSIGEMIKYISSGLAITFQLVPLCIISTLILGFLVGMLQFRRVKIVSHAIDLYIVVMRGVPPLVVMYLLYCASYMNPFIIAFLALTIYHTAYVAEVVRGGFEAIPKGQFEAGASLGLSYMGIMIKIYAPQVMLQIVPALCGQYILLVKDTTLVSVVGVQDIMWRARQVMEHSYQPITVYLIIGCMFYILCSLIGLLGKRVDHMLDKKTKQIRI